MMSLAGLQMGALRFVRKSSEVEAPLDHTSGLSRDIWGCMRIRGVTWGYMGIHGVMRGYMGIYGVI